MFFEYLGNTQIKHGCRFLFIICIWVDWPAKIWLGEKSMKKLYPTFWLLLYVSELFYWLPAVITGRIIRLQQTNRRNTNTTIHYISGIVPGAIRLSPHFLTVLPVKVKMLKWSNAERTRKPTHSRVKEMSKNITENRRTKNE